MDKLVSERCLNERVCKLIYENIVDYILKKGIPPRRGTERAKEHLLTFLKGQAANASPAGFSVPDVFSNEYFRQGPNHVSELSLNAMDIFFLYNRLHQQALELVDEEDQEMARVMLHTSRKVRGTYYTPYSVASYIVRECIGNYIDHSQGDLEGEPTILEPCVGTGVFVVALADVLLDKLSPFFQRNRQLIRQLIENRLYCADIDKSAIEFLKAYLPFHLRHYFNFDVDTSCFEQHVSLGNSLMTPPSISPKRGDFDVIFFNPPYELLKPNESEFKSADGRVVTDAFLRHKESTATLKARLRESGFYEHSLQGMLNLYKLFIELATDTLSSERANIGFIVPLTLLGDYQCKDLRKHILSKHRINSVVMIPEKNSFFEKITQAFCIVNITKNNTTSEISIKTDVSDDKDLFLNTPCKIDIATLKHLSRNEVIVPLNGTDIEIIEKISMFKKLGELKNHFINARGEIDLTKYKTKINSEWAKAPLVRGDSIGMYRDSSEIGISDNIDRLDNREFIEESFSEGSKLSHCLSRRIACQQISNLKSLRRLKFSMIREGIYLGNSCNYIIIRNPDAMERDFGISYESLICLLNSSFHNWRFKVTSTNNHISNNELDDLAIPFDKKLRWLYENLKNLYMKYKNGYMGLNELATHVDANVFLLFGLDALKLSHVLKAEGKSQAYIEYIIRINSALPEAIVCNHVTSKLSDLDMKMVTSIPPGGNWKDIPKNVPSRRLEQIRKSGARTTLYGRLRRDMPSFTISTYFNRPGNGTYIHPDYYDEGKVESFAQNRMISLREAARFQSFKDDFVFCGSKASILKQIGNAVPPILGFHIARKLISSLSIKEPRVIDLFCGAGGLSHGFREAGCKIMLGLDNFADALSTYHRNTPEAEIIDGDITEEEIKESLYGRVGGLSAEIIVGGPPCQGYSHAGWRIIDDPRNLLFKEFVQILEKKQPQFFVMENVEGILTINSGSTYTSIIQCFKEIGYQVVGRTLNSAEYGVPQRRKRVFIIGSKKGLGEDIFPPPCFRLQNSVAFDKRLFDNPIPIAVTAEEAISDLPFIRDGLGEDMVHATFPLGLTEYQAYMKGLVDFDTFYEKRRNRLLG
jgi:Alw26I/Eco31I/Esp3I family type II restriction m6 adenine DNA methyltransferase